MACNEFHGFTGVHRRKVVRYETKSTYQSIFLSLSCNHCKNPVCITICPENNYRKRQDGIVILDSMNCKACLRCVEACPFQAPKLNPKTHRTDKCDFCVERIDQGLRPVCVDNCPTGALSMILAERNENDPHLLKNLDIPIMSYTNPSIYIVEKLVGRRFLLEG
jgi:Fe-S-cluster-containing dehydrogenase component